MAGRKIPEEQRRESLLRAAFAVAAREGLAGVTARAVAAEAGVSSGLVFFHFHTVDTLLAALLEWLLAHTFVAAERPIGVGTDESATRACSPRYGATSTRCPRARERSSCSSTTGLRGTRDPAVRGTIRRRSTATGGVLPLAAASWREAPAGRYGPARPRRPGWPRRRPRSSRVRAAGGARPPGFDVDAAMATLAALVRRAGGPRVAVRRRSGRRPTRAEEGGSRGAWGRGPELSPASGSGRPCRASPRPLSVPTPSRPARRHRAAHDAARAAAAISADPAAPRAGRPHVVVVGGGFGGLHAARALRKAAVDVTLVDRTNHHLFQPLSTRWRRPCSRRPTSPSPSGSCCASSATPRC
jgi:AcrR family transcriptional regulator